MRSSLLHESVEVRAAGIRAFRYFIQEATHVQHFYRLNLDFLVVRSVDIVLDNKAERMQALRLIRKLLSINPSNFSPSFTRCLLAIAKDGHQKDDKDVILRTCLATLSELLLLNPTLCQRCRVIPALMDALLNASHSPLIIEAIVGSLLYTMNDPDLRSKCSQQLSLHKFIAPFTDYPYVSNNPMSNFPGRPGVPTIEQITDSSEFKDHRLATTRFILLSLFRSWPGFLYMCSQPANHIQFDSTPNNPKTAATNDSLQSDPTDSSDSCVTLGSMSALHCLLSMLRMPFEDTRRVLLEFFFELFYLPLPDWTDDFEMARTSISSLTNVPDQWALYDGFVASEAKNLLPSLSVSQNLFENHLSLLLHVFIRADLLSTLTTIIIESACVQNSVRATLLLGELLYLTSRFLPAELSQRCHGLAPLLHACVDIERSSQQRAIASAAVSCLQRMHSLQKRPLTVHSIFLEMLLQQQTQSINHGMLAQSSSSVSPNTRPMPSFCSSSSSSSLYPAPDRPSKSTSSAKLSNSTSKKPVHLDTSDELKPTPTSSTSSSPPPPLVEPSTTSPIPPSAHRRLLQNAGAREHEDSAVLNAIRRSQTLMREPIEWNWQLICTLLRWPGDTLRRQEDHTQRSFVRRLVQFYKPNSRQFSGLSNNHAQSRHITLAGLYLLRFLLDADDAKCGELLQEFLSDLHQSLAQVANDSAPPTAALSASRLLSSHAAHYFLFIGQLSACNRGRKILEKHGFFDLLLQLIGPESGAATSLQSPTSVSPAAMSNTGISSLATASALATSAGSNGSACSIALNTHCDTFAKLIVSCLHYGPDAPFSRTLLGKVLTGSSDSSRLYATNFLRVLLRLRLRDFGKWALELLVTQLADINEQVNSAAIDILHEACESADLLDTLVALRPSVLHLGDRGVLLIAQLASCPNGLKYLQQSALLGHELQRWSEGGFQMRYARFTEQLLNDTFTLHSRADDLSYGRRVDRSLSGATSIGASSSAMSAGAGSTSALFGICGVAGGWRREAFSPAHLYGSLAAHAAGVEILNNERTIDRLQRTCCELCCVDSNGRGQVARVRQNTPLNLLKLKAMIWSIGHIGSSSLGVQLLSNSWLLIALIRLTGECSILSVRAVGFYSLGLIGRSESGRQFLAKHGWTAVRHSRHERWPVCEQMLRGRLRAAHAPHLILPQDENMEGDSLDVNVKYSGVEEDHDNHINGDHQNSSHELRQLNRQFERNVHLQQSRDSMLFIDADETDRQQRIARPTSVNVRHWIESDRQQIDQDSIHKSFDTLNPNDSINSTVLPEIASLDENESFHGLGSSINEPEVSDSEPVPIDSEGAKQPFGLPEPVLSPDNVKKTCADKTLASDAIVRTTDRKYPALGTYLLQQRNARPHSQTLPNKRTQRPHSQTHLSPYSSGFNSAGVPRRKISEPTGCAAPSIYQSCSHLYFTSSGQCALCCSSIDARGRTQSGLDDSDPYNRSQTESFGGSSASVSFLLNCFASV